LEDERKKEVMAGGEKKMYPLFLVESISSQCVTYPVLSVGTWPMGAAGVPGDRQYFSL
jgi:hypothetical protein